MEKLDILLSEIEAVFGKDLDLNDKLNQAFIECALKAMEKYKAQEVCTYINTIHVCKN